MKSNCSRPDRGDMFSTHKYSSPYYSHSQLTRHNPVMRDDRTSPSNLPSMQRGGTEGVSPCAVRRRRSGLHRDDSDIPELLRLSSSPKCHLPPSVPGPKCARCPMQCAQYMATITPVLFPSVLPWCPSKPCSITGPCEVRGHAPIEPSMTRGVEGKDRRERVCVCE